MTMRELLNTKIPIVLPTMVAIQALATMCSYAAAVVAVQAAADLGVKSTNIGVFTAVLYVVAMLSGLAAGGLLVRYGVIRTSQMVLLAAGLGLCLAGSVPWWPVTLVAAAMIGMATGPLNPADPGQTFAVAMATSGVLDQANRYADRWYAGRFAAAAVDGAL